MRLHHLLGRGLRHRLAAAHAAHHDRWHAARSGPFGGDMDEAFAGEGGWRGGGRRGGGGRMFGHGDLKLLLLSLIEQQPRHGYELIRIIGEMFHGFYTPSPGAIYPTLTLLEDLGHAQVAPEPGGRKLYSITAAGRAFLEANRDAVEAAAARTEHSAQMAAKMALPIRVREAMHALKHAMMMRGARWDKTEAQRVAAILERAASEIAQGPTHD